MLEVLRRVMKYFHTSIILLVLLSMPAISRGAGSSVVNIVSVTSNSGSVHVESVAGADGQSVSSSAKGADGADGANGTVIQKNNSGNSSARVDVHTEINGVTVEDTHTTVRNGDAPYERSNVYENNGTRVETHINASTDGGQAAADVSSARTTHVKSEIERRVDDTKQKAQEVEDLHDKRESEVAPITSQYISEGTDTSVTAAEVSGSEKSTPASPMHRAVEQLHRILSGIFTYVSNIFA